MARTRQPKPKCIYRETYHARTPFNPTQPGIERVRYALSEMRLSRGGHFILAEGVEERPAVAESAGGSGQPTRHEYIELRVYVDVLPECHRENAAPVHDACKVCERCFSCQS